MALTIEQALRTLTQHFATAHIAGAATEAMMLLNHVAGVVRLDVILTPDKPLTPEQETQVLECTERRLKHEPLAYILGEAPFWGLDFTVTPAVLIPRADTETLVATVLALLPQEASATVVDVGTGSGCILTSVLVERPKLRGIGVDISPAALDVAWQNITRHGVATRAELRESDVLAAIDEDVSLIVSNPPYITEQEMTELMPDVANYEPHLALVAGEDGLNVYRSLILQAHAKLHQHGLLALEIGHEQQQPVKALLNPDQWQNIQYYQDLSGKNRVLIAVKR